MEEQKGKVEFMFDIVCPFARLAGLKLRTLMREGLLGKEQVEWIPVLLGGIYALTKAPQTKDGSATDVMPVAKKVVLANDLKRWAAYVGTKIVFPPGHPRKSLYAMQRLSAVRDAKGRARIAQRLFDLYWGEGKDVADRELVDAVFEEYGEDAREVEFGKARLRAWTDRAVLLGAPGVPFFYVPSRDRSFWGQDRLHFVLQALGLQDVRPSVGCRLVRARRPLVKRVTFYFDVASPWAYIASTQIERIVRASLTPVSLEYCPILLGGLFRSIGTPNMPLLAMSDNKRKYSSLDMNDWVKDFNIPFTFPDVFPIRSVLAQRVLILCPAASSTLFRAAWSKNSDISTSHQLEAVLRDAGFTNAADLVRIAKTDDSVKGILRANTERAMKNGVCGVPFFETDAEYLSGGLWGTDRLFVLEDALAQLIPAPILHPSL
eukprot:CAMPEP_0119123902 /NCGR_PEP_ID=MMETSP1310-20130426/3687_1 /TAXON_ID=464262 /ORGANISM="Genus nov. species nov., Strain RCC2339" /LENGTH=432 /DNA_ID=CAMNT_0007113775 /DNA_START=61 /DNA_END=1359 /DNA_ORIENTATION=-